MSKPIIVVNDVHLRDNPPSSATETYQDDLFDLLHQVSVIAKARDAQVVFAGDVIDFKQPTRTSHKLIQRAIGAFKELDHALVTPGNHDMSQDRFDSVMLTQPLGVIIRSGALTILDGWHEELPLFGVPWQMDWHNPEARYEAFDRWRSAGAVGEDPGAAVVDLEKSLVVTHCPLYPPGQENEFDHIPTQGEDGISEAMGHMGYLAYGHIHEYHGIFESEGVTYSNMGALSRGSLHEYNRTRPIAVVQWTSEDGFEQIDLDYKPADEVFRIAEIDQAKAEKLDLDNFLEEVGKSSLTQSTTEAVREFVSQNKNLSASERKRALTILDAVT